MHKRNENFRDEHNCWDFGGGGVEFNESLNAALAREVKEEYNADILEVEFLGHKKLFREHDGKKTHWLSFVYLVKVDRYQVINNEPEKHDEIAWFTLDNLPTPLHSMIPGQLEMLRNKL
jgi:ADP-ribose pyrophosphatase YjhB (NUDIX family)